MNAAVTARTRKQRKESHLQLAPGTRHNDHTTPCSAETSGLDRAPDDDAKTRHLVAQIEDVALARCRRQDENEDKSRGAAHPLRGVPGLDRQALVAPKDHSTQARAASSSHSAPRVVALHPLEGGSVERRRSALLRRLADVVRLGRTSHRRRLALTGSADESRGAWLRQVGIFDRVARGSVAEYLATVPRTGSVRFW